MFLFAISSFCFSQPVVSFSTCFLAHDAAGVAINGTSTRFAKIVAPNKGSNILKAALLVFSAFLNALKNSFLGSFLGTFFSKKVQKQNPTKTNLLR